MLADFPQITRGVNNARSKHQHLSFCQCCAVLPCQLGSQLSRTTVSQLTFFTLSIQWHCFTFLLDSSVLPFLEHPFTPHHLHYLYPYKELSLKPSFPKPSALIVSIPIMSHVQQQHDFVTFLFINCWVPKLTTMSALKLSKCK